MRCAGGEEACFGCGIDSQACGGHVQPGVLRGPGAVRVLSLIQCHHLLWSGLSMEEQHGHPQSGDYSVKC